MFPTTPQPVDRTSPPRLNRHGRRANFISACFAIVFALFVAIACWVTTERSACGQAATKPSSQPSSVGQDNRINDTSLAAGWISLFDGQTLYGWKAQSDVDWRVSGGAIVATRGQRGLLRTTSQFSQYELRLEFNTDPVAAALPAGDQTPVDLTLPKRPVPAFNSGVFLHTSPRPKNPATDCYEINIASPEDPFPTGGVVARKKRLGQPAIVEGWNQMRIVLDRQRGTVFINGDQINEFDAGDLGRGFIGLQFSAGPIRFRNLFLRPLNLKPIFGGENLDAWIDDQANDSRFTIADGNLHMQSGPGQLESKQQWADFVLNASIKTNAPGLNSGIFFRCIANEKMNGYESQIQNQMIDGDPAQPLDCGTGGIFRRQNARKIVARDQQWFYKTIVAVGPHISVWVNGYQVTDWTDRRKPDANPRRGLRLEAGSIMLQGHDPTTDILFGEINVSELLPRR